MSDVIDRPILAEEAAAKSRLRIIDCDVHPSIHAHSRSRSVPAEALAGASGDLWQPSAHALYRHHALSALLAADRAPRRLAADRRAAGLRSRFHAQAASRSARCRVRHSAGARPLHLLAAEPRIRRRDPARHQRLAARVLVRPRSAAEGLDPRRPGRHASSRSPRSSAAPRSAAMCRSMSARAPTSRSAAAATGRSTNARRSSACRSASTSAAMAGTRRPAAAGRLIMSRSTSRNAHTMAAQLTSLVLEGVPERFPKLKIVFIEGGFGWIPSATWRMDRHFEASAARCRISSAGRRNM